jgi:Serine dehydrogenase proteinase
VIVPNRAKSAATVIALGADEIIMGYCSELGPIDAQVPVLIDGFPHYISAQSFIDARKSLEERFREVIGRKEGPRAILQQIASLNAPFIDHCEKLMDFSREVARKYLKRYMFKDIKPVRSQTQMVDNVLQRLSSVVFLRFMVE